MSDFGENIRKRFAEQNERLMGSIYRAGEKEGISKYYLNSFYDRIIRCPLKQTKSVIGLHKSNNKYHCDSTIGMWVKYLRIMIALYPTHEKAEEWKKSLEMIEQNKA